MVMLNSSTVADALPIRNTAVEFVMANDQNPKNDDTNSADSPAFSSFMVACFDALGSLMLVA